MSNTIPDPNPNVTTADGLSPEMKTYYAGYLIDLAQPELVHDQFGQKHTIPKNGGKTIRFRQFDPLPEMTTPLTEGVTPDGQSVSVRALESTVRQYGSYVTLSDMLELTAVDNNILQATKLIASQAGRTLDTITREILNAGTVVQYADGSVSSRAALTYTSASVNHNLTVAAVKKAVRYDNAKITLVPGAGITFHAGKKWLTQEREIPGLAGQTLTASVLLGDGQLLAGSVALAADWTTAVMIP